MAEAHYATVREILSKENYHTPEPLPPDKDPRAKGLKWPGTVAAGGLIIWAFVGYGIAGLGLLPPGLLDFLTLLGAVLLAIGSEAGTLSAIGETFRKYGNGEAQLWDWVAIIVSQITTITAVLVAWSRLRQDATAWTTFVVDWGPMVLAVFASMDIYFGHMEFGLYCSQFDKRHKEWREKYEEWCELEAVRQGLSGGAASGYFNAPLAPTNGELVLPKEPEREKPIAKGRKVNEAVARQVISRDGLRCFYCGVDMTEWENGDIHIDHFYPASKGGGDHPMNLVVSCKTCNLSKGSKLPTEQRALKFKIHLVKKSPFATKEKVHLLHRLGLLTKQKEIAAELGISPSYVSASLSEDVDLLDEAKIAAFCRSLELVGSSGQTGMDHARYGGRGVDMAHATDEDWQAVLAGLEWSAASVPLTVNDARRLLKENGYELPSESTLHRWVREASNGNS